MIIPIIKVWVTPKEAHVEFQMIVMSSNKFQLNQLFSH